jgi:hypothetical protein
VAATEERHRERACLHCKRDNAGLSTRVDGALRIVFALVPLALGGCTAEGPRPAVTPAATIVGKPESCIFLPQLRETRARDDWTIDFIGDGGIWRNTLTSRCPGLKANDRIGYETSLNQLCSTDIVYVLETAGGELHRGAACGLARFVPVKLEK